MRKNRHPLSPAHGKARGGDRRKPEIPYRGTLDPNHLEPDDRRSGKERRSDK